MKGSTKLKTKISSIIAVIILAIVAITAVVISRKKVTNRVAEITSPEILRSINYDQVQEGDEKIEECDNKVNFSAYFLKDINGDGRAEKLYGSCQQVGNRSELYIDVNVEGEGHIENGVITIDGKNFKLGMSMLKDTLLKNNTVSDDVQTIELNPVTSGISEVLIGNIDSRISTKEDYTKVNQVILTGTYVPAEEGATPVQINKAINLTVDWYGTTSAYVHDGYQRYSRSLYVHNETVEGDDEKLQALEFKFAVSEMDEELIIKGQHVEVTIPQCAGDDPVSVTAGEGASYDPATRVLTIDRETSAKDVNYTVTVKYKQSSLNKLKWSDTGYTIIARIKAKTICYNNTNEEFSNPLVSSENNGSSAVSFQIIPGTAEADYIFTTALYTGGYHEGKVLSKQPIYERYNTDEDVEDISYWVEWTVTKNARQNVTSDIYINDAADQVNGRAMDQYTKYTGISIYGSSYLPAGGTVKVINRDTDEVIKEFTRDELNGTRYDYGTDIRHIRIEASESNISGILEIRNYKVLETNKIASDFTMQEVMNMTNLYTKSTGHGHSLSSSPVTTHDETPLVGDASEIRTNLSTKIMSSTETLKNEIITINTVGGYAENAWQNGVYLVEIPSKIVKVEVNDVVASRGQEVLGYEVYQENGKNFIKVITSSNQESYPTINIDCNLVPDPRSSAGTLNVEVYAYNELTNAYWNGAADKYDLDEDGNVQELVAHAADTLGMAASNTFVTVETVTDYNENGDVTIAPNVAKITNDTQEAAINVTVLNNYETTVENIVLLGKVPFEGNTYVDGQSLRSTFTTTMQNSGIEIPTYLQGKATVYYTAVENPTNDITVAANGWKEASEWSSLQNVKNYLIVIDKTFNAREGYTFTYKVTIPNGLSSNDAAYSCHKVWFDLNTSEGKLNLQVQPTKVGVRVVRPYNFDLTKYKEGTDLRVNGAVFKLWEEVPAGEEDNARIKTTNMSGMIELNGLVVNQIYNIEEIKAPNDYTLKEGVVQFKVVENANGNLEYVQMSQNTFKNIPTITIDSENISTVNAELENEPKYKLIVNKVDEETQEGIQGIKFLFDGNVYTTGANGILELENLEIGKEYTLVEIEAKGFFLLQHEIKFSVVKNTNGTYNFVSDSEYIDEVPEIENLPSLSLIQVPVKILNAKIPRFDLQIEKIEDGNDSVKLANAKFILRSQDVSNIRYPITDANGLATVDDLYQYVENTSITGRYTLKEEDEPYGYIKNDEEIEFYVYKNAENKLEINITDRENLTSLKDVQIDGSTVKFVIQDKPLFKIIKKDKETGEPLANVDFAIYEIDQENGERGDFAKDAQGNYIGTQNSEGTYVVTTGNDGTVTVPLRDGVYKLVEVTYPKGYKEKAYEEIFEVSGGREYRAQEIATIPTIEMPNETTEVLEIDSVEDLLRFVNNINNGVTSYSDTTVKLTKDIDFRDASCYESPDDQSFGDVNKDGTVEGLKAELEGEKGYGFPQIGVPDENDTDISISTQAGKYFTFGGILDGQGHEIRNICIKGEPNTVYGGLIKVAGDVRIINLGMTGKIQSGGYYAGSFVGRAGGSYGVYMENCYNKCSIIKPDEGSAGEFGGLIGYVDGGSIFYMNNCYNEGNIVGGNDYIGGLVGCAQSSSLFVANNCHNSGNVTGGVYVGGLFGKISSGQMYIYNSYNTGDIHSSRSGGASNYYGGIAGKIEGGSVNIDNCYNTADIYGEHYSGGLFGSISASSKITNSYNSGSIILGGTETTCDFIGGIVGGLYGSSCTLENVNNYGNIGPGDEAVGGIAGQAYPTNIRIFKCGNTGKVSGRVYVAGVAGKIEAPGAVQNCYNLAEIQNNGGGDTGGIVGKVNSGGLTFYNCYNQGNINYKCVVDLENHGYYPYIGGISGHGGNYFQNCYNTGDLTFNVNDENETATVYAGGIYTTGGSAKLLQYWKYRYFCTKDRYIIYFWYK